MANFAKWAFNARRNRGLSEKAIKRMIIKSADAYKVRVGREKEKKYDEWISQRGWRSNLDHLALRASVIPSYYTFRPRNDQIYVLFILEVFERTFSWQNSCEVLAGETGTCTHFGPLNISTRETEFCLPFFTKMLVCETGTDREITVLHALENRLKKRLWGTSLMFSTYFDLNLENTRFRRSSRFVCRVGTYFTTPSANNSSNWRYL